MTDKLSHMGSQMQSLIDRGVVTLATQPIMDFPSAMIVLPVYDSGSAVTGGFQRGFVSHAELARRTG
ncbi:hypothetical protein SAMN05421763_103293 [[Luteovulum] sphaeroides subsp. megalophilum]|uniref:hypothetical protein n=1 Tax=Cereibacter sphaeroides TaxID=1063 RepID=UPI000B636D10|nr:hypothetical protein [Cereibacter sphaeroides]SNS87089.1 hypothetical protein SAMN05421763_103293 [[Luteovulum] sphaeroides subsp. megalophilum]